MTGSLHPFLQEQTIPFTEVTDEFCFRMRSDKAIDKSIAQTLLAGAMPKALLNYPAEELWDCNIQFRSRSRQVQGLEFSKIDNDDLTVFARLHVKVSEYPSNPPSTDNPKTLVCGVVLHNTHLCIGQEEEIWTGDASITPLRRFDGRNFFARMSVEEILASEQFIEPQSFLQLRFEAGAEQS